MKTRITGQARPILFGSVLLVLSISSFAILRGVPSSSPSPPVTLLNPTLEYHLVNGDSQVIASLTLGNGCLRMSDWGTTLNSEKNFFSATARVIDTAGPTTDCTLSILFAHHTYSLGYLPAGDYTYNLTACTVFPSYQVAVDCSNKASMVFQVSAV